MEKIMWLILGGTACVAAVRAGRSVRAMYVGRVAVGILFVVFGAAVNAIYLAMDNGYYDHFADSSPFAFVQNTSTLFPETSAQAGSVSPASTAPVSGSASTVRTT